MMPDEASTHYAAVVDQLIEGHKWIRDTLGIKPNNAWINDPFGYSSTMPYLWKKSGIKNMVILRMHQAIKGTLMRINMLDFKWRPYWNAVDDVNNDVNDILVNVMPYPGYWNSDVCGPDQEVCKKFNFLHMRSSMDAKPVTDDNVADLAEKLYNAYKFTANLYQYKNLIIFLGEDCSYDELRSFTDTNMNYGKLIQYINNKKEWGMHIGFGTIEDYFRNIRDVEKSGSAEPGAPVPFPLLSGDFFPYSDFNNDTWTGYYTTRIWMKRFVREIEPLVRMADAYSVLAYQQCAQSDTCVDVAGNFKRILGDLRAARRDVGMFQHHDGITGTSLSHVVSDYESRLQNAFEKTKKALKLTMMLLLTKGKGDMLALEDNLDKQTARSILTPRLIKISDQTKIFVANPLEKPRLDVVRLYVDRTDIELIGENGESVPFQLNAAYSDKYRYAKQISFPVHLKPYEISPLTVKLRSSDMQGNKIPEPNLAGSGSTNVSEPLTISNKFLTVKVNRKSGTLEQLIDSEGKTTKVKSLFLKYKPKKSGAYLFGPAGPAEPLTELLGTDPTVTMETGSSFSEIRVAHRMGFTQTFTLYHVDDVKGRGVHITNEITLDLAQTLANTEVVMRFHTDIDNGGLFFTDQNGFQLMGRKNYPDRPIEINYYPMTTMVVLEDENKRLTLHSAQSHGVASLSNGCLEVMLDRNVHRDDGKGLGTGMFERVLTLTEFILQIEHRQPPEAIPEERFTYPSVDSVLLNELLQSKTQLFSLNKNLENVGSIFKPTVPYFPCDLSVVGWRFLPSDNLETNDVSLVLHRKPVHCSFPTTSKLCSVTEEPVLAGNLLRMMGLTVTSESDVIKETTLSHMEDVAKVSPDTDLRPVASELRSFLITTNGGTGKIP